MNILPFQKKKQISEVLRNIMELADVTQVYLASETDVKQSTISRILNPKSSQGIKKPTDYQVKRIADFFGIRADELRGEIEIKPVDLEKIEAISKRKRAVKPKKRSIQRVLSSIESKEAIEILKRIAERFESGLLGHDDMIKLDEISDKMANTNFCYQLEIQSNG